MTNTKALSQIRAGILAANNNVDAPQAPLARKAYRKRSLALITAQAPRKAAAARVRSIRTYAY